MLSRFPGCGSLALTLFPDPVTGRYKSDSWQALGEELRDLLTPDEYASATRDNLQRVLYLSRCHPSDV